jgi:PmbA protein
LDCSHTDTTLSGYLSAELARRRFPEYWEGETERSTSISTPSPVEFCKAEAEWAERQWGTSHRIKVSFVHSQSRRFAGEPCAALNGKQVLKGFAFGARH